MPFPDPDRRDERDPRYDLLRLGAIYGGPRLARRAWPAAGLPLAQQAPWLAGGALARPAARGALRLGGGPLSMPINLAVEGLDIGQHGYNLPQFRQAVTPDNTVFGYRAPGWLSYLGSSANAVANPIRTTHLTATDLPQVARAVPAELSRGAALGNQAAERFRPYLTTLREKVRAGTPMTAGQQADFRALSARPTGWLGEAQNFVRGLFD